MSHVNLLAHALHSLMAIIGIARMVVGLAAVLEQPLRDCATSQLLEESVVLHLASSCRAATRPLERSLPGGSLLFGSLDGLGS